MDLGIGETMYYEERLINGVMCCRYSPNGLFEEMTLEMLSEKYQKLKTENIQLKNNGLFGLNVRKVNSIPDDVIIMVGSDNQRIFLTGIGK